MMAAYCDGEVECATFAVSWIYKARRSPWTLWGLDPACGRHPGRGFLGPTATEAFRSVAKRLNADPHLPIMAPFAPVPETGQTVQPCQRTPSGQGISPPAAATAASPATMMPHGAEMK